MQFPELLWINRNQLEDNISRYAKISVDSPSRNEKKRDRADNRIQTDITRPVLKRFQDCYKTLHEIAK
jgi:hypothetical protein